ncbi:MAG: histidine kinase, partial [Clostridiales bacterium]|nr:histidine kinase [Clostridiales bacterium]
MREKKIAVDVCPYCGFSLSDYQQNTRCLAINTILAGKYLVGKALGQGGFGITYMGLDLNMETRVAIKEYFPVEL